MNELMACSPGSTSLTTLNAMSISVRTAGLGEMIALLEDALRTGSLGMSSGLFTPPGSFAQPDEMMALCAVLKRHNAAYFTHIRDESNKVLEAVVPVLVSVASAPARCRRWAFVFAKSLEATQHALPAMVLHQHNTEPLLPGSKGCARI
jgi:N-acyl-D-aspartate/D-glutamate deacylase